MPNQDFKDILQTTPLRDEDAEVWELSYSPGQGHSWHSQVQLSLSLSLISTIELASVKRKACISHGSSSFPASHYVFSGNIQVPCFSFGALLILISFPELWKIDVWYCKTTSQVTLLWILGFVGEGSW